MTKIIVLGEPVAKERARVVNGRAFTPRRTKAYEENVAWTYRQQKGMFYAEDAVKVKIQLFFQPPKRTTKKACKDIHRSSNLHR